MKRPVPLPAVGGSVESACRVEVRPSGPQGDGVGIVGEPLAGSRGRGQAPPLHSGWAAACALRRAGSDVLFEGPCAALVESPPVEPPERTSGTDRGHKGLGQ